MARFKVVITDFDYGDNDVERSILEPIGAEIVALRAKHEDELLEEARDCDAIMNQYARVGARTIDLMRQCKVIARYGVGVDIVDVEAATRRNIQVTNVRDYCTEEVADHAIAMWLALARKLADYDRATHKGVWHWSAGKPVHRLRDRTMGVVSFGQIGQAIGVRGRAFGVKIIAYDPYVSGERMAQLGAEKVDKDALLRRADYVVMQAPMTDETRHFLGPREFEILKPGAFIVNTGRGPTIDNAALYAALVAGRVAGAALDDPEEEPAKRASWSLDGNPLFTLPNVMVTSHVAYYSEESIRLAREIASGEVARVLTGQTPNNPVNHIS